MKNACSVLLDHLCCWIADINTHKGGKSANGIPAYTEGEVEFYADWVTLAGQTMARLPKLEQEEIVFLGLQLNLDCLKKKRL